MKKVFGFMALLALVVSGLTASTQPVYAGGGSGGGGSTKPLEIRVTGYVTAIDYEHGTIVIGASYYGTGSLSVNSATKVSLDNISCSLNDIQVGDWAEARYDYYTKVANKISAINL